MNYLPFLEKGDTIYLIAPSFGCTTEPYQYRLKIAIRNLRKMGYKVIEGRNVHRNIGNLASAGPKVRADEFMEAYSSKAKLIISVGGGELMCDMMPFLNFEKIKAQSPKWFMGFSDNTNLTFTLATLLDIPSVYGPNAPSFAEFEQQTQDALEFLEGKKTKFEGYAKFQKESLRTDKPELQPLSLDTKKVITAVNYEKPFEGTMIGGCLDILSMLCGTKYDKVKEYQQKHPEGLVWYLEACDLNSVSVHRALWQLKEAGWFDNAKGFIIGRPLRMDEDYMGLTHHDAVKDILEKTHLPILLDADLGHLPPALPFINNGKAKVKFIKKNIEIEYSK